MTTRFSPRPSRSTQPEGASAQVRRERQPLDRPLDLAVQLRLLEADLAEMKVSDGEVTLLVDPIFEMACDAARQGLADCDAVRQPVQWCDLWPQAPLSPDPVHHQSRRSA